MWMKIIIARSTLCWNFKIFISRQNPRALFSQMRMERHKGQFITEGQNCIQYLLVFIPESLILHLASQHSMWHLCIM